MDNSWDLPFFLMQSGADERLGNLESDNTVYPFSFCDLFLCRWLCSCLKEPTKSVCDAVCISFSVFF